MHVHVSSPEGEAKFWLEPILSLASETGLGRRELAQMQRVVEPGIFDIFVGSSSVSTVTTQLQVNPI